MKGLRRLYRCLPVLGDLKVIRSQVTADSDHERLHRRILETTGVIQALEALKAGNERYRDPLRLLIHGAQYWSQNYEDGMILEIFRRIGTTNKTFLEIGVGFGLENNTASLFSAGWTGWWIEGSPENCASIRSHLKDSTFSGRLTLEEAMVSPKNIEAILSRLRLPTVIDLFSLDIDLHTYHLWDALSSFRPRVVVVEYNGAFAPSQAWVHPFDASESYDGTQAFGASLKAYELLGRRFGYSLVGCDITGSNAFFVLNEEVRNLFASPFTAENHYEPVRYHLGYRNGHPAKFPIASALDLPKSQP